MAYTEVTQISASYSEQVSSAAIWNNGAVEWNVVGNVETAHWNVTNTSYSTISSNSTSYTEQ